MDWMCMLTRVLDKQKISEGWMCGKNYDEAFASLGNICFSIDKKLSGIRTVERSRQMQMQKDLELHVLGMSYFSSSCYTR